jgi:phosphate transport system substrate-binding protein
MEDIMKLIVALVFAMCANINDASALTKVNGAGASFPYPIYSKWFSEYEKSHQDIQFNYQAIGSGGGIRQLIKKSVDFGATDAPMHSKDKKRAKWKIKHIPSVIGALTISFNLKNIDQLNLDGETIAKIYLNKITKWNHADIKALNPETNLPDVSIKVVRRKDDSGSTYILSDFLNASSKTWRKKMRVDKKLRWNTSAKEVKGNMGMTQAIKSTENSIGYVELAYALKNDLKTSKIKNRDGKFVLPTIQTITAAADAKKEYSEEAMTRSIVFAEGEKAYPISAFTYFILPVKKKDNTSLKEFKNFLSWALNKGQLMAPQLHYAPLPKKLSSELIKTLR